MKAKHAYGSGSAPTRTTKSLEYEVIARVTHTLKDAAENTQEDFPSLVKALNDNRQLWQIFASDVANSNNRLPQDLRARIFSLAEFTFAHTRQVLARKESVGPLIEINAAIMRGLTHRSG